MRVGGFKPYRYDRRPRRSAQPWLLLMALVLLGLLGYRLGGSSWQRPPLAIDVHTSNGAQTGGRVLSQESARYYTASEAAAIIRQDYGASTLPVESGITKVVFRYRSYDLDGTPVVVFARAYLPTGKLSMPVFAFAPGTTGIGDACAGSLEVPAKANWANYDAHMMAYASQGYATVITDYEGMRDPTRLHHYMVGALEGRAVLDSIRALEDLRQTRGRLNTDAIVLGGYSQGGHAAFWADKIAADYAPDVKIAGVVGWGPVMDVRETWSDVTRGANINWFGPFVLTSYADYYHRKYDLASILQPPWIPQLTQQVTSHCVDSVLAFWGHEPTKVYQPAFLTAITSPTFNTTYPELALDMERNIASDAHTASAKLINEGSKDNVVLPIQQQTTLPIMCQHSIGPVQLKSYPATHYDDMTLSFRDTLAWMTSLRQGARPVTTCPAPPA